MYKIYTWKGEQQKTKDLINNHFIIVSEYSAGLFSFLFSALTQTECPLTLTSMSCSILISCIRKFSFFAGRNAIYFFLNSIISMLIAERLPCFELCKNLHSNSISVWWQRWISICIFMSYSCLPLSLLSLYSVLIPLAPFSIAHTNVYKFAYIFFPLWNTIQCTTKRQDQAAAAAKNYIIETDENKPSCMYVFVSLSIDSLNIYMCVCAFLFQFLSSSFLLCVFSVFSLSLLFAHVFLVDASVFASFASIPI